MTTTEMLACFVAIISRNDLTIDKKKGFVLIEEEEQLDSNILSVKLINKTTLCNNYTFKKLF